MTRIIFALISLAWQIMWLLTPRLVSSSNPFSVLSWYSIVALPVFLILSKVFYWSWIVQSDWKMWALYLIGWWLGSTMYILALKNGGNISTVISITQLAIIGATIVSFFLFHEKINTVQMIWIALLCIWSIMVLGFSGK